MTVKRTFSLPDDVSAELDHQAAGNASAFVAAAVREKAARDRLWGRYLELYGEPDPQAYAHWQQRLGTTSTEAASAQTSDAS